MNLETLNDNLHSLYKDYYSNLLDRKDQFSEKASCPLLMQAFQEYVNAKRKILIVGKETNWWVGGLHEKRPLDEILQMYKDFALGYRLKGFDNVKRKTLTSPFWNFSRNLYRDLNQDFKRPTLGLMWTNISKMDNGPENRVMPEEFRFAKDFQLLLREIEILEPTVVVFLTGYEYDHAIQQFLGLNLNQKVSDELNIRKVTATNSLLPFHSYKVYHPRYMYSNKTYYAVLKKLKDTILNN